MALFIGAVIYAIITNNRWTDIINKTARSLVVTVDGEEQTIKSKSKWRFKVKNATPIRITAQWSKSEDAEVKLHDDYSHGNFQIIEQDGGIAIDQLK